MWTQNSVWSNENLRSAIANCVCPECGGAIEIKTSQFRCIGLCGKEWRAAWDSATQLHTYTVGQQ
jgi:hypothetical protein